MPASEARLINSCNYGHRLCNFAVQNLELWSYCTWLRYSIKKLNKINNICMRTGFLPFVDTLGNASGAGGYV